MTKLAGRDLVGSPVPLAEGASCSLQPFSAQRPHTLVQLRCTNCAKHQVAAFGCTWAGAHSAVRIRWVSICFVEVPKAGALVDAPVRGAHPRVDHLVDSLDANVMHILGCFALGVRCAHPRSFTQTPNLRQ